jgi:hypothetical protein
MLFCRKINHFPCYDAWRMRLLDPPPNHGPSEEKPDLNFLLSIRRRAW